MQATSRQVSSNQQHLHPKLPALVRRHLHHAHRKPPAPHNVAAFQTLLARLADGPRSVGPRPLVLDSFCGTGHSTLALARRHPQHLVVGIDKSARRLAKHPANSCDNCLLLQAECEDLWQLLALQGLAVDYHYLLYPNPWPKGKHLQRRIHASAGFRWLLQLSGISSDWANAPGQAAQDRAAQGRAAQGRAAIGRAAHGYLELRSNWQLYVEEFGVAMHLAGARGRVALVPPMAPLSLFERKYRDSGHALWAFTAGTPLQSGTPP